MRLVRYLFVQNALLAAAGLVVGLLLAFSLLELLRVASPLQSLRAPGMEYRLDLRAFGFAAAASLVIAAVLSLAPMRLLGQIPVQQTLREGALNTTTSLQGNRMQQLFVVVQTACAVVLLVGTGIMVKTVLRFGGIALGYDADRIVQVTPVPAHAGRVKDKYLPLNDRLLAEFAAIPGVQATALRASVPFGVGKPGEQPTLLLDGARVPAAETQPRNAYGVSPDYFTVMGIPLVSGRTFTLADAENAPAVATVNDWVAQHWWPGENAVGRTFTLETAAGTRTSITVVGVVRDNLATQGSVLLAQPGPEIYRPYAQANFWVSTFYARASGAPAGRMLDEMQKAVMRQVPNGRPNGGIMATLVDRQVETVRSNALQIARFALIGLLLAITGLYGVLSNVVQQRTREIGIRGALGATPVRILTMVVSQALLLAAVGIAAGLLSAAFLLRLVRATLYGTPPLDLLVYAGVALLFLVVSFAASVLPARRAMRVDPTSALRAT
jgi:predicted permease